MEGDDSAKKEFSRGGKWNFWNKKDLVTLRLLVVKANSAYDTMVGWRFIPKKIGGYHDHDIVVLTSFK